MTSTGCMYLTRCAQQHSTFLLATHLRTCPCCRDAAHGGGAVDVYCRDICMHHLSSGIRGRTAKADGSSRRTGGAEIVHRPAAQVAAATRLAERISPARVSSFATCARTLACQSGLVMKWAAVSACLATRVACWCCPAPASAPATCARAPACRPGSVKERAIASACWCCPAPASTSATRCQGLRLDVRVDDGTGCRLGLPGDPGGLLVLPRLGQRPRDVRQGPRLLVRFGDGAGCRLGLPGDPGGLLVLPRPGQRPRYPRQGARLPSGPVMERAAVSACPATRVACWCCPAPASTSATCARACACQYGSVMERATASACPAT